MIRGILLALASSSSAFACDLDGVQLTSDDVDAPRAFVALDTVPLARPFSMQVLVCDPDQADDMRVDAMMPAHQHGMNYTPQVTDQGKGVFQIDGMLFHMPGEWEIQVDIEFDQKSVPYTHIVTLK